MNNPFNAKNKFSTMQLRVDLSGLSSTSLQSRSSFNIWPDLPPFL